MKPPVLLRLCALAMLAALPWTVAVGQEPGREPVTTVVPVATPTPLPMPVETPHPIPMPVVTPLARPDSMPVMTPATSPEPATAVAPVATPVQNPVATPPATPEPAPIGESNASPEPSPAPAPSAAPDLLQIVKPVVLAPGTVPEPMSAPTATPAAAESTPTPTPTATPAPAPQEAAPAPAASAPATSGTPPTAGETTVPSPAPIDLPAVVNHFSIEIDLTHQVAYLLVDGHKALESPISSGRKGKETSTGNFEVIQKDLNHLSNLYGKIVEKDSGRLVKAGADAAMPLPKGCVFVPAPMKWFMRFDGATGMHAGILPGYAASHGCVRMPAEKAELFYETIDVGTPVHVFGTAPEHEEPEQHEEAPKPEVAATRATPLPAPKPHHGWLFF